MSVNLSEIEFEKIIKKRNFICNKGKTGSLRSNNSTSKIRKQTVRKVSRLQKPSSSVVFEGHFGISVEINSNTLADGDNILKGILDSLQGFAYENDRYCREYYVLMLPPSNENEEFVRVTLYSR